MLPQLTVFAKIKSNTHDEEAFGQSEKTGIHWDPLGSAGTPAGHPGAMFVHDP